MYVVLTFDNLTFRPSILALKQFSSTFALRLFICKVRLQIIFNAAVATANRSLAAYFVHIRVTSGRN